MSGKEQERGLPVLPCACASLRRASRAVTQAYDRELREAGVNTAQLTLLRVVRSTGGITQGRLGKLLALDSTTLSRTLRPVEAKGWLRCTTGVDRRERHWQITSAGRNLLERAGPAWERAQRELSVRVGEKRFTAMLEELAAFAAAPRSRPRDGAEPGD